MGFVMTQQNGVISPAIIEAGIEGPLRHFNFDGPINYPDFEGGMGI